MIIDGSREELTADLEFDVCVVGSGAAGYIIARKLARADKTVCVLESSFDDLRNPKVEKPYTYDKSPRWYGGEKMRALDKGIIPKPSTLRSARPDFFTSSRTRSLGGSTNSWAGLIRPLDESDFARWPINRSDLRIHYEEVMQILELGYFDWFDQADEWKRLASAEIETLNLPSECHMKTVVAQQQTDTEIIEMKTNFKGLFDKFKNLCLIRNATAVNTEIDFSNGIGLSSIVCCPLNKVTQEPLQPFRVKAKQFVLAMGGIETPRFLMNQFRKHKLIYPMVGQSYLNSPRYHVCGYAKGGSKLTSAQEAFYNGGVPLRTNDTVLLTPYLVPAKEALASNGINNFRVQLDMSQPGTIFFDLEFEQAFNPESKLVLDDEYVDIFNQPLLRLEWNFTRADAKTLTRAMELLKEALRPILNFDDFRYMDWNFDNSSELPLNDLNYQPVNPSNNHLGAIRMNSSDELDDGLLDSNLKFKGFDNMWVCSTAAFPSGGYAPPAFTLMALANRLATQLSGM